MAQSPAEFQLFISPLVLREAGGGDPDAATRRIAVLNDLPLLELTEDATTFARVLVQQVPLPAKAAVDALHIAITVVHGIDYLLTWNCTHIANAALRTQIDAICRARG